MKVRFPAVMVTVLLAAACIASAAPGPPRTDEERARALEALIAQRAVPTVQANVGVTTRPVFSAAALIRSAERGRNGTAQGSGALLDRCHVLTAAHVVVPTGRTDSMAHDYPDDIDIFLGGEAMPPGGASMLATPEQLLAAFSIRVKGIILATGVTSLRVDGDDDYDPPAVDWAVLQISPCVDSIRPLALQAGPDVVLPTDSRISLMGFPGIGRIGEIRVAEQCPVADHRGNRTLVGDCELSPGMSGGPIVAGQLGPDARVVGIIAEGITGGAGAYVMIESVVPARLALEMAVAHRVASAADVRTVQRLLSQAGFAVQVTGIEDNQTRAAIWRFQQSMFREQNSKRSAPIEFRLQTYVTPSLEDSLRGRLGEKIGFRLANRAFCGGDRRVAFGLSEDGRHYTMQLGDGAAEQIAIRTAIGGMTFSVVPVDRQRVTYLFGVIDEDHAVFESVYDSDKVAGSGTWRATDVAVVMHKC